MVDNSVSNEFYMQHNLYPSLQTLITENHLNNMHFNFDCKMQVLSQNLRNF